MSKWQNIQAVLLRHRTILLIYIAITIIASLHLYSLGTIHDIKGRLYTDYNNYIIFKQSFFHLVEGKKLYKLYPGEQWDLYKYSPAFALGMGVLAWLPDIIGLTLWNLANALALYAAIRMLPINDRKKSMALWFILLELLTSVQSSQSNGLMAACLIGAFALLERRQLLWATLLITAATFIKVYGAIGYVLILFYPGRVKFILYSAMWVLIMLFIPMAVLTPYQLWAQYRGWFRMMARDQGLSVGFSVMGWLATWFGLFNLKNIVTLAGIVLFFIPLLRFRQYQNLAFRLLFLAYMLIWVIIFNHKAESSTFIIAISGVAIWYFSQQQAGWRKVLLITVFIFSCLSPTDLFPASLRHDILVPYVVKVVPCIIVWCALLTQLLTMRKTSTRTAI